MSTVIAKIANNIPSEDLLTRIDTSDVYNNFYRIFQRLDDFKRARDKHEQRNFFSRLFNSGELKSAQLDAQEVQAEFSKTLAQLMVISSLQAQELTKQQGQLADQQKTLDAKAEELARQNIQLEQHQAEIKHQAASLRQYITDLLNVQGLTEEHGEKLISIAEDVLRTRDHLLAEFDNRMHQVQSFLDEQQHLLREDLEEQANSFQQSLATLQQAVGSTLEQGLETVEQGLLAAIKLQGQESENNAKRLDSNLVLQAQQQGEKHLDMERQLSELRKILAGQTQALDGERGERLQEQAKRQTELDTLRSEHSHIEAQLRSAQRRLMAGLCGLALVGAGALAGLAFWRF